MRRNNDPMEGIGNNQIFFFEIGLLVIGGEHAFGQVMLLLFQLVWSQNEFCLFTIDWLFSTLFECRPSPTRAT
jgi:hypothetical protein